MRKNEKITALDERLSSDDFAKMMAKSVRETERRLSYPGHRYPQDQAPQTLRQTSQGVSGNAPPDTVQ